MSEERTTGGRKFLSISRTISMRYRPTGRIPRDDFDELLAELIRTNLTVSGVAEPLELTIHLSMLVKIPHEEG